MIIEGKKGNDTITGGIKEDIYVVNSEDGEDVIKTTGGGEDIIRVNASSDSLSFKKMNENDMVMFLRNVNDSSSLTLTGYLDQQKHETQKIKQIETMRKNQTNKLQI
jgi:Ca2+-binding RTX toxin-like protein